MLSQLFSLKQRVALVTGASMGLGREIATIYAEAGAHVLINSRNADRCEKVAAQLRERGLHATALSFDVGDNAACEEAIAKIEADWGRLDILVNNVGQRLREPIDAITPALFEDHLHVNLVGPYQLARRAARSMAKQRWGRIIMLTSVQGAKGRIGDAAYITAKGGLAALTRALAAEYGQQGICVNALCPGSFATEINAPLLYENGVLVERARRGFLMRPGQPAEIAGPALLLASEAASYMSGHELVVDGGMSVALV
jgi:gluconate 5-dehydrogenase